MVERKYVLKIQIGRQARLLAILRMTMLVTTLCVFYLSSSLLQSQSIDAASLSQEPIIQKILELGGLRIAALLSFLFLSLAIIATMIRHFTVIHVDMWKPLMIHWALLFALSLLPLLFVDSISFVSEAIFAMASGLCGVSVLLLAFWTPVPATGEPLKCLLQDIAAQETRAPAGSFRVEKFSSQRALIFAVFGFALLAFVFVPRLVIPVGYLSETFGYGLSLAFTAAFCLIVLLGHFFVVRSRRYSQARIDSLLATDRRPPILFLRSFEDDWLGWAPMAGGDISLEARLADHFSYFGPFIAVRTPGESVPQIGAARAELADDKWQAQVKTWISDSSVVVLFAGRTKGISWELDQVLDADPHKLILIMPERRRAFLRRGEAEMHARFHAIKKDFDGTAWSTALTEIDAIEEIRAIILTGKKDLAVICSTSKNRESYHLASMLAHYMVLKRRRQFSGIPSSHPMSGTPVT